MLANGVFTNALRVLEVEPNDTRNTAQPINNFGTAPGQNRQAIITGTFDRITDVDHFRLSLRAGDIISARAEAAANELSLLAPNGVELQGHSLLTSQVLGDPAAAFPPDSPLLRGGNANIAYVIPEDGNYFIFTSGAGNPAGPGGSTYTVTMEVHRPFLESQPIGTRQTLHIDFEGGLVPRSFFDPTLPGIARLSPLDEFLPGWGLDERFRDDVIDVILDTLEAKFDHIRTNGNNGDFSLTGNAGEFDIQITNSRDHGDLWGLPHVSRIFVGGTEAELGIPTLGIAQTIDVGNFDTEEQGVVLLDTVSTPGFYDAIPRHPTKTLIDVIGTHIAVIVAHEAGHFFGAWHHDDSNLTPSLMDTAPTVEEDLGVGPDGIFGTDDDVAVNFTRDRYEPTEHFTGIQDVRNALAFGLSTGTVGATINGTKFGDVNGNGVRDANEAGLGGFTIFADMNGNGVLDDGEPRTITRSDGTYSLKVPPGPVTIREIQQSGFRQTFPAGAGTHTLNVAANQVVNGINFGNQAIAPQAMGNVFLDLNGNGQRDPGEVGLAGVWVYADLNGDGRINTGEPTAVTDQFGNYSLALPGPGTFQIRQVLQPGFVQTTPPGGGPHVVTVNGPEVVGRDFGNQPAINFGDAPLPYPTLLSQNGARHGILPGFHLGATVLGASDGQPSSDASADAGDDGVSFSGPLFTGMNNQITVTVNTGQHPAGLLQVFFDWNQDGDWDDPGEHVIRDLVLPTGTHVINIPVPATARIGNTFARFRYSHVAGLGPRGAAPTGEVEDYRVLILENRPNANDDQFDVLQDEVAVPLDVLANDFASSTGILRVTTAGTNGQSDQGGVVTVPANGQVVFYSPRPGFFGVDSFQYTVTDNAGRFDTARVTINVLPSFEFPVAVDDSFNVPEGVATHRLDVLQNDIAGRSGPINIVSFGGSPRGTVQIIEGGQAISYRPPILFPDGRAGGTDQFTYTVADSANPAQLSTATVTVHVQPGASADNLVNFVLQATDMSNVPLGAGAAVQVGDQFKIQVLVDDLRPGIQARGAESAYMDLLYDTLRVSIVDVQFGSLYPNARNRDTTVPGIINEVGAFAGFADPGSQPVELFTVIARAVAPGVAEFKSDPADDLPLRETVLRPNQPVSFQQIGYGTTSILILGDIAGGPKAVDDSRTINAGAQNVAIDVLRNDSQGTGDFKELLSVGTTANATVSIDNDIVRYTPNPGFEGTDQFIYTMGNGTGLTSTATVTVHVLGPTDDRIVDFTLQAVNPSTGLPITQVGAGQTFVVNAFVQDTRPFPPREFGVFSAYMDLLYDANLATVDPSGTNPLGFEISFGPAFPNSRQGDASVPGIIDEVGAIGDASGLGQSQDPVLLYSIQFTASSTETGQLVFRTDPADVPVLHDVLLYDSDVPPLQPSQISFGELRINVVTGQTASATFQNPENAFDVNGDGVVSPIDALIVINDLNRNGARTLESSETEGAEGEADQILYIDVNGDGQLSPVDVLHVINYLNQGGTGEGESFTLADDGWTMVADHRSEALPADSSSEWMADASSQLTPMPLPLVESPHGRPSDSPLEGRLSLAMRSEFAEQPASSTESSSVDSAADQIWGGDEEQFDSLLSDDLAADVFAAWDSETAEEKAFGGL